MPFSYPEVDVGANTYKVYADVDTADEYNGGQITAAAWNAPTTTTDVKGQGLTSSTRWMDEADWIGTKTDPLQLLDWPRTGIPGVNSNTLPPEIQACCAALAAQLVEDPSLRSSLSSPLPRDLHAGSVSISFFRPRDVQVTTFFPASIMSLVGQWLVGVGGGDSLGPVVVGVSEESPLDDDLGLQHGI